MKRNKIIVVGLGNVGIRLIRMLARGRFLTCIENKPEAIEAAPRWRGESLTVIQGDATSRLTLEEAGADNADTVLITTTVEKINIEVARVLRRHFQVPRIISLGITPNGIKELEALQVEVENIFQVSAMGLRNRLEHTAKAVHGIGLGKNEILEVEVHPHSKLANKSLQVLSPKHWKVGIIYREGRIVVPHGDTTLSPKDRLVILGEPKLLNAVSEMLRFRFQHFPLEYGNTTIIYFDGHGHESFLAEVDYLFSVFPLRKAVFVCPRDKESVLKKGLAERTEQHGILEIAIETTDLPPLKAVKRLLLNTSWRAGMLILPKAGFFGKSTSLAALSGKYKQLLRDLSDAGCCPVLLAAGTFPYVKAAVPCVEPEGVQKALEAALEVASTIDCAIEALFVNFSRYITSEEDLLLRERMRKTVSDLSLVHGASIKMVELEGNPILALCKALESYQLTVINMNSWRHVGLFRSLFRPDVAWQVVSRSPASTLLIPPFEAAV